MEKRLKILLLGIVSLFGIGVSFAGIQGTFYVDYFDNSGNNSTYSMGYGIPTPALRRNSSLDFSLSSYSLQSSVSYGPSNGNSVYYNPNGNRLLYVYNPGDYSTFIFPITSTWQGLGWGDVLSNTEYGIYSRVLCNNTLQSDILTNSSNFCDPSVLFINNHNTYTISSLGDIYDTRIDGVDYYKGPVASSVGLGYSFGFVDGSGWQNDGNHYYLNNDDKFYFRSILLSGSSVIPVDGPLVFRISSVASGNYQIFALGPTGDYQDFSFVYSIYNCPVSVVTFEDCSFSQGGNVSGDFSYDFISDNPYSNLIYFLTKDLSQKFSSSYSSSNHTLDLTRVSSTAWQQYTTTITLNLIPSSTGIDILGGIPDNSGGDDENPFGIFGTKSLFYYCNVQMSTYDSLFCYNPDGSRKSDDELKNCYVSKYANLESGTGSSEFYCIDDRGLIENIDIKIEGSGSVFVPCESDLCQFSSDFSSLGLTGYSVDFFDNYLNSTGYFFKCPWPYDNKLTIWPKLITLLNGVDILLPINCGIAGFLNGKSSINFENSGHFIPNGPLLSFEGDNRTLLYYFFDIIISIGIFMFVGKIFYFFHK